VRDDVGLAQQLLDLQVEFAGDQFDGVEHPAGEVVRRRGYLPVDDVPLLVDGDAVGVCPTDVNVD
jgi:hypothetical protein